MFNPKPLSQGRVGPGAVEAEEVEATWAVQPASVETAVGSPHGDGFRMAGAGERGPAGVVVGDGPGGWRVSGTSDKDTDDQ